MLPKFWGQAKCGSDRSFPANGRSASRMSAPQQRQLIFPAMIAFVGDRMTRNNLAASFSVCSGAEKGLSSDCCKTESHRKPKTLMSRCGSKEESNCR